MTDLAVVGIGGYGWHLVQRVGRLDEQSTCRLVAAADSRLDRFASRAEQLRAEGVELFDDAMEMFRTLGGKCQAVYIATSIHTHAPLAIAATQAGYHVYLEKPPAATVQEVDAMIRAVDQAGTMCMVGFQAIHGADIRFLKDRIVSGRLGEVESLSCCAGWPRDKSYYDRNEWAGKLRVGEAWVLDSPSLNALSHQINNMLFLASDRQGAFAAPTAVRAELYAAGPRESHDTAAIEIRTADGPSVGFLASHCSREQFGPVISIRCRRGRATYTMGRGSVIRYEDGTEESCPYDDEQQDRALADFVRAVRSGRADLLGCDLTEGRKTVLAVNGAHESSRTIHRIDGAFLIRQEERTDKERIIVSGLDEYLKAAAERHCLLSDLDPPPAWARTSTTYDLAGYDSFPRQFVRR